MEKKGYKSWVSLSVEEKSVNFIWQNDVSSLPYKQIIACCFICKLPVQPATTFQEIHVLNIDFNSHDEIKNMNNICRDASGCHSTYIRMPCCSMRASRKTCFVGATWKRFLLIKLLLLTCMYTWFVGTFFGIQPCGIIRLWAFYKRTKIPSTIWDPPWCFLQRGIKGHRYCLSTVFPLQIVSFSHQ